MSWISQNYEKAAIGGGLVVAAGLAFLGWSKLGSVPEDFNVQTSGRGNSNPAVVEAEKLPQTASSLEQKRIWERAKDGERSVDLFTGVALFVKRDGPTKAIDPYKDPAIHPPIENVWWLDNRIDPGFADSPQRDPDKDGFSNLEEFQGKTDPNDAKSHPSLLAKLKYVKDESLEWLLDPGLEDQGTFSFRYVDSKGGQNRAGAMNMVKPGDLFFANGVAQNRFKLLGSEKRQVENPRTHAQEERTYLKIEDQRPNKKGTVYEIPNNIPEGIKKTFSKFDRTAVLTLEAAGEGGKEFKVEENTRFALPSGAAKKDYLLKSVTPQGIEVEHVESGETKVVPIPKS